MKNIIKGLVGGIVIGFIAGNYLPAVPCANYDAQIEAVAITTKIIYGVCPNAYGVSAMKDFYLETINNVEEKQYILNNFNTIFNKKCRNINIVNP